MLDTFNTLQGKTDPAFELVDQMLLSSGGDLIVFLHAMDPGTDPLCGYASINALGRQGDFQSAYHRGELITVVNIGPDCLGLPDLAPAFAANMGIVPNRIQYPDGGTFPYSSGYGVTDVFTTITARLGTYDWGVAEDVNRFSNPEAFCKSLICGVDRNDIAAGADAVFSMNRTRHLVSALTDSAFPVAPEALEDKLTVTVTQNQALEILQTAIEPAVFQNEFVTIQVDITNTSGVTLNNLDVSFAHLSGGLFSVEPQTYENSFHPCRILGSDLITTGFQVGDVQQKIGSLTCFIEQLAEDENIAFSYRLLVDDSPPILNGDRYYHELVTVNNIAQLESEMCIPVFVDLIDALGGNTACDNVQIIIPGVDPGLIIDLDESPTITGSRLTLPFIRLSGGELIRAEFMVVFNAEVELQMIASSALDPLLTPTVEATYDELSGLLFIDSLQVGTGFYEVQATYVLDSDPVIFTGLTTILLGP